MGESEFGLILSGGGARGAYQAGVLKGIAEIHRAKFGSSQSSPFPVITGVSAGAINATYLAAKSADFLEAALHLCNFWNEIHTHQVFETSLFALSKLGLRLIFQLALGGIHHRQHVQSLLNSDPLHEYLRERMPLENLKTNLDSGYFRALGITATDYADSANITFVVSSQESQWNRTRRIGLECDLKVEHIMASAAIPIFFPPVEIDGRFFGDGSLRNMAPLSPAIHLGAEKLLIVSVKKPSHDNFDRHVSAPRPTAGRILSVILNGVLLDQTEFDIERLTRINQTLALIPDPLRKKNGLRPIEYVWIQPSHDLGKLAQEYSSFLPPVIKYLLRGLGNPTQTSEIISYLLFHPAYCGKLVEIGYRDALAQTDQIEKFFNSQSSGGRSD